MPDHCIELATAKTYYDHGCRYQDFYRTAHQTRFSLHVPTCMSDNVDYVI